MILEMGTFDPMTIEMKLGKEYKHTSKTIWRVLPQGEGRLH